MTEQPTVRVASTLTGILLQVPVGGGAAPSVPMPLEHALALYMELWKRIGDQYPRDRAYGDEDLPPPRMFDLPSFSRNVGVNGDGKVSVWLRAEGRAGIAFEFPPDHARQFGQAIVEAAPIAEEFVKPRN